jgi:hypothetical protein
MIRDLEAFKACVKKYGNKSLLAADMKLLREFLSLNARK